MWLGRAVPATQEGNFQRYTKTRQSRGISYFWLTLYIIIGNDREIIMLTSDE